MQLLQQCLCSPRTNFIETSQTWAFPRSCAIQLRRTAVHNRVSLRPLPANNSFVPGHHTWRRVATTACWHHGECSHPSAPLLWQWRELDLAAGERRAVRVSVPIHMLAACSRVFRFLFPRDCGVHVCVCACVCVCGCLCVCVCACARVHACSPTRDAMRRKGKAPRDHARDNIRAMRDQQRMNRAAREEEERRRDAGFKMKRFQNVSSRVDRSGVRRCCVWGCCVACDGITCAVVTGTQGRVVWCFPTTPKEGVPPKGLQARSRVPAEAQTVPPQRTSQGCRPQGH